MRVVDCQCCSMDVVRFLLVRLINASLILIYNVVADSKAIVAWG